MSDEHQNNDLIREEAMKTAKDFKSAWINLGQVLHTVYKDKLFRDWDFQKFEDYAKKEIRVKKETAMKLLRSYYFMEKNEPTYLKEKIINDEGSDCVPEYESVDLLRRAKNRPELNVDDYTNLRDKVLEQGQTPTEVKKELTSLIKQREDKIPEEVRAEKRLSNIKRMITLLCSVKQEIIASKTLPAKTIDLVDQVVNELNDQI